MAADPVDQFTSLDIYVIFLEERFEFCAKDVMFHISLLYTKKRMFIDSASNNL